MIFTTTPTFEGRPIKKYLGIVSGEAVLGAGSGKSFMAELTNIFGGRVEGYEDEFRKGKSNAFQEMSEEAIKLGANAIVGIDIDYQAVGDAIFMIVVNGTAVEI